MELHHCLNVPGSVCPNGPAPLPSQMVYITTLHLNGRTPFAAFTRDTLPTSLTSWWQANTGGPTHWKVNCISSHGWPGQWSILVKTASATGHYRSIQLFTRRVSIPTNCGIFQFLHSLKRKSRIGLYHKMLQNLFSVIILSWQNW